MAASASCFIDVFVIQVINEKTLSSQGLTSNFTDIIST